MSLSFFLFLFATHGNSDAKPPLGTETLKSSESVRYQQIASELANCRKQYDRELFEESVGSVLKKEASKCMQDRGFSTIAGSSFPAMRKTAKENPNTCDMLKLQWNACCLEKLCRGMDNKTLGAEWATYCSKMLNNQTRKEELQSCFTQGKGEDKPTKKQPKVWPWVEKVGPWVMLVAVLCGCVCCVAWLSKNTTGAEDISSPFGRTTEQRRTNRGQ